MAIIEGAGGEYGKYFVQELHDITLRFRGSGA